MPDTTVAFAERAKILRNLDQSETRKERAFVAQRVELRAADAGSTSLTFTGYASVVDTPYDLYGGPAAGGWSETIVGGAFSKTLSQSPDVAFLINHTGLTLARTKSGTLTLSQDAQGLAVEASLDSRQSPVADLSVAMERGDIDEMSFAFRVVRDKWLTADGAEVPWWDMAGIDRQILEVNIQKGDVSVVNYGANPATSADLRSVFAELRAGRPVSSAHRAMVLTALGIVADLSPAEVPCSVCGKALTDPDSIAAGIGPDCAAKLAEEQASAAKPRGMSLARARILAGV